MSNFKLSAESGYLQSLSKLEDWDFECGEGENATRYYEKGLLEEIGEQIEAYLNKPVANSEE